MVQKQLAELVAKECGKQLDKDANWDLRTVQGHIQQWRLDHPD